MAPRCVAASLVTTALIGGEKDLPECPLAKVSSCVQIANIVVDVQVLLEMLKFPAWIQVY
jgi:hypothetical protein